MAEKVLVIGSGAREHALAWKLAQSAHVKQVLVAPGNAGTANNGKISNSDVPTTDHNQLIKFCQSSSISLVVVGPEAPLAAGLVDDLMAAGVRCFGPTAKAAQLEASKSFSKDFMIRHGIPTAKYKSFTDPKEACDFIKSADFRALVVKASGLAAGKGVVVAASKEEACKAVNEIMQDKAFGEAGDTVVVEELLEGEEVSCLCFTDGLTVAPIPPAQDHKRLEDGDQGPNTGGMGAYCPAPQISKDLLDEIRETVLQRTVNGIREEGTPYVGVLYAGLMLTKDGPKVLEFNCRFGDPECQVILPLLQSDLYEVIQATIDGRLAGSMPVWLEDYAAVTVVMASGGYPGSYNKGLEITGLSHAKDLGLQVFHAGTTLKDGKVVTSGGRVLTVTSVRKDLLSALEEANKGVSVIEFSRAVYRKDIGFRAIAYLKQHRHLTYKDSGVDIEAGNTLVRKIKPFAAATARPGCNAELGGFAGLFDLKAAGFIDPIMVSGTDGVGTKLKIAHACHKHDTIGQDLVAMCVNDILAQGAEPLFFLDYFGCGALDVSVAESVVSGIAKACQMAGCALLGGETAEMPGMYAPGEYDLAGFAVGAVERGCMLPLLEKITAGDFVIGVSSSGVHSNGFSLVRKILEKSSLELSSPAPPECGKGTLGELLLTPTKIYSKTLLPILKSGHVKAYAHITGGGLLENIPRVLPSSLGVTLDAHCWKIPGIFSWLHKEGGLSEEEMSRTFNCGIGAVLVVEKTFVEDVLKDIRAADDAWVIGQVILRPAEVLESVDIKNLTAALNGTEAQPQKYLSASVCDGERPGLEGKVRVAVLISGTGTNLDALIRSTRSPGSAANIALVISNKANVGGLQKAEAAGIPTKVIDHRQYSSRQEFDNAVDNVLEEFSIELVCLAGFMRILSGPFVRKWNGKILNIHPSLLPSFKGAHAHKLVLDAGVRVSGCTVHFVAEEVDAGAIICQVPVPVKFGDTVDTLSERVKEAEHRAFPEAMQLVASGGAKLGEDGKICWSNQQI
ncbi:trifunctional purine biosynthetic protein adenosine-3-like isoform X1 [Bufo bufo]|uniref:trifunctional purine biosynthetic protein adenosine-3-like isoform X1 n=1 Tax=Bufo bufo TaxID=8384 RepID=UPI001ABE06C3|nr:trifunctional purine biosynthetic protein adenosine-3-like isoform X1 [Bufo bufo]XP_040283820.1 trifunctional purine biosynthetic protein adenosine-3-like isoform X1 [Bufo bufo]XP_040283828.1 trifunctional purine biosynthetic protein adenosine-3-like isoform X1 [Bufo bufo]